MLNFNWWRDKDNRDGASAIVDVLKVLVPAALVVAIAVAGYLGFSKPDDPAKDAKPDIECNSSFTQTGDGTIVQNCGDGTEKIDGQQGNDRIQCNSKFEQDGAGNLIQVCGDGTVIIGLTQEKFFAELERREQQIRADMNRASVAERKILQLELDLVAEKMANSDATYRQTVEELRLLRIELKEFSDDVPIEKLQAAQAALFQGDRSAADQLLAEIEAETKDTIATAARAAFLRGEIAEQEVRWADAANHYERAARLDPGYDTLIKAGDFLQRAGRHRDAIRYKEQLVGIAKQEFGTEHAKTATALNNLAVSYRADGRYAEAEPLYREALEIDRKALGVEHLGYGTDLNNLARLLYATGRYDEAEPLYREALEIARKALGVEHPSYGRYLNNLAGLLQATGRYDEAEPLYREALEIGRKALGVEHPSYGTHLNNLAGLLEATGRYDEAEPLYREAVAVLEAGLGVEHPDTQVVRGNLELFLAERAE